MNYGKIPILMGCIRIGTSGGEVSKHIICTDIACVVSNILARGIPELEIMIMGV
ncbi:MAG: hypothetical protein J7574_20280 [Flavobacterium sp.]|uniref:hypothetical protein n=1 Tax=Flavobacterium sp. TaxID=239 RepID=UPI001B277E49|nr:hypothetical protein [Flavobacterium sp.]MBO9586511.1 hypothetical protein [Flavobacterium sp.]